MAAYDILHCDDLTFMIRHNDDVKKYTITHIHWVKCTLGKRALFRFGAAFIIYTDTYMCYFN